MPQKTFDADSIPFHITTAVDSSDQHVIHLAFISAAGLPNTDGPFDKIDPYVIVIYGPLTYHSEVYHGLGTNPEFTQNKFAAAKADKKENKHRPLTFRFPDLNISQLTILLFDHDYCRTKDDFLGKYILDLSTIKKDKKKIIEVDLLPDADATAYSISRFHHHSSKSPKLKFSLWSRPTAWPAPSLRSACHRQKIAGMLKSIETGNLKSHKAHEIALMYVHAVFGDTIQKWNADYDKAKQIFSQDSWSAGAVRTFVASVNHMLYSNSLINTKISKVEGGQEFLALLKNGVSNKTSKAKLFTYVILEATLVFSETGKGFVSDMISKHAVHSGASTAVVYSGEFHVSKSPSGEPTIVFDNNSGTYSPNPADLPKLLTLLKANFPGVGFDCVDFNNPQLAEYKQRVGLVE